ncbi:unnamed protein product [Arctogadus glacialis]
MKKVKAEQEGEFHKLIDQLLKETKEQERKITGGAAGEGTPGPSSTPLLSTELPAGLETSTPPAPSSETQPAGLETSIPPAPSSETQPAGLETSIPPAPSSETQPAGLETSIPPAPSSETQPAEETTPLMSSESPAPTGDQQEHTSRTTTPDVTMDGHDDDQSLDALAYRSGTGQLDIEMGPVQTLPKERLETSIPPAPSSETQPAGLETSIPPAPSSETQPAGLETSIPPAPSSETQPAGLETSIPPAPSSETQPAGLETSIPPAPSSETQPAEAAELLHWASVFSECCCMWRLAVCPDSLLPSLPETGLPDPVTVLHQPGANKILP